MTTPPPNIYRLEIVDLHSNAVTCVRCEIHGHPGEYNVTVAKSELATHIRKHADRIAKAIK
jgi:hypothetical protein